MDVMYATDEKYAPICGVSLYSLLKNNTNEHINVYIFEKNLGKEKDKFLLLTLEYDVDIVFIDMSEIEIICEQTGIPHFRNGYTAYARLFADRFIGKKRVLYLDCDTLIVGSLIELWNTDLCGKPAAAVLDCSHCYANRFLGKKDSDNYINSGVILIDYEVWNKKNCTKRIEDSLNIIDVNRTATLGDQDILNHALGDDFFILSPRYNAMYITRYFSPKKNLIVLSRCENHYYPISEIEKANINRTIIHFAGRDILRPWFKGCVLSKSEVEQWDSYMNESPWKDFSKPRIEGDILKRKLVAYYLINNPTPLCYIHGIIKKYILLRRLKRGKLE